MVVSTDVDGINLSAASVVRNRRAILSSLLTTPNPATKILWLQKYKLRPLERLAWRVRFSYLKIDLRGQNETARGGIDDRHQLVWCGNSPTHFDSLFGPSRDRGIRWFSHSASLPGRPIASAPKRFDDSDGSYPESLRDGVVPQSQ